MYVVDETYTEEALPKTKILRTFLSPYYNRKTAINRLLHINSIKHYKMPLILFVTVSDMKNHVGQTG